jgi:mannose-6-phosphate isomerase-like protein (cupin superfamily)
MEKVNIAQKFRLFSDYWSPKIAAEVNDCYVKFAKFKGDFIWHRHEREDELFLVVKGRLSMKFREREIELGPGEFLVVPRGVEHLPSAAEETHVIVIEPKSTLNTGNVRNEQTATNLSRI